MNDRGLRYLELARRCRVNAAWATTEHGRLGLIRMAEAYENRGYELVSAQRRLGCARAAQAFIRHGFARAGGKRYAVSFSAAMAATMARISSNRTMLDGSWNQRIPTMTVPTAPMPPHTA